MAKTELDPRTVPGLLAEQRGNGTALIYGARQWSYAELDEQSRRVAGALAARGIGPGDRVGVWLPNCPAYVLLLFACARLGAVAVAVNTRYRSAEVQDIIGRAGCKALAMWPGFKGIDFVGILGGIDPAVLDGLEFLIIYGEQNDAATAQTAPAGLEALPFAELMDAPATDRDLSAPDRPCNIFTTSGTTKAPKFVLHRQSAVVRHARDVARGFGFDAPDARLLQAVPLCGVFGFSQYIGTVAAAAPSVFMSAFDAEEAVRLVRQHDLTHTCGGDDMADRLLGATDEARPLPTLRHFGYAKFNAALSDIVERAGERGMRLIGLYGSSEVLALFSAQPADASMDRRKLGGGFPVASEARVRARDPETRELLPHGRPGELEIRAPSLMIGYDGDAEATRAAFTEDGFFRTGDVGYSCDDGSFVYLSRAGDVLRLGGFLVNPAEIEAHLQTHAAVNGCQVVGAETARGTAAVAFVTLHRGAAMDETALKEHCRGALAAFKVPVRVFVMEAFPTTESANGIKIQRTRLREMAQRWLDDTPPDAATGHARARAKSSDPG